MQTTTHSATAVLTVTVGMPVLVKCDQSRTRLGPPKCPGRSGIVVRRNSVAGDDYGGLWYVKLDATARAKAREETFWGEDLAPHCYEGEEIA